MIAENYHANAQRALERFAQLSDARLVAHPLALYKAIDQAMRELVGYKLLTVLRLDGLRLYRMHTSDLDSYPAGGFKSIAEDAWLQSMLGDGLPVISPNPESVRQRFFDHETIFSLACGAVMNIPVVGPAGTLGSLNLLNEAGWFTPQHVLVVRPFAALLALAWSADGSRQHEAEDDPDGRVGRV